LQYVDFTHFRKVLLKNFLFKVLKSDPWALVSICQIKNRHKNNRILTIKKKTKKQEFFSGKKKKTLKQQDSVAK
jgi:hypothetical protein